MFFTTSWDDNCLQNKRIGNFLKKHGVKGTFYIDKPAINRDLIKDLSVDFEFGSHTISHPHLTDLGREKQKVEIERSKQEIEDLIGKSVELFAYPYGEYDKGTVEIVKECGYQFARTARGNKFYFHETAKYEMPVGMIFMPTKFEREKNIPMLFKVYRNRRHFRQILSVPMWKLLSCYRTLCYIIEHQSHRIDFLHIWGHAWQVDQHQYWNRLDALLSLIRSIEGIKIVDNKQLFTIACAESKLK